MSCILCEVASGTASATDPENTVLLRSRAFFAKPGLGHFSPGYSLICSMAHVMNMAMLPRRELRELEDVVATFAQRLRASTGRRVVMFEHGTCGSVHAGSCIDHAHVHLLPVPDDIDVSHEIIDQGTKIGSLSALRRFGNSRGSYFFFDNGCGVRRVTRLTAPLRSQFARQLLAARLGIPDEWDWAVFPRRTEIRAFVSDYQNQVGD